MAGAQEECKRVVAELSDRIGSPLRYGLVENRVDFIDDLHEAGIGGATAEVPPEPGHQRERRVTSIHHLWDQVPQFALRILGVVTEDHAHYRGEGNRLHLVL